MHPLRRRLSLLAPSRHRPQHLPCNDLGNRCQHLSFAGREGIGLDRERQIRLQRERSSDSCFDCMNHLSYVLFQQRFDKIALWTYYLNWSHILKVDCE